MESNARDDPRLAPPPFVGTVSEMIGAMGVEAVERLLLNEVWQDVDRAREVLHGGTDWRLVAALETWCSGVLDETARIAARVGYEVAWAMVKNEDLAGFDAILAAAIARVLPDGYQPLVRLELPPGQPKQLALEGIKDEQDAR